MAEDYSGDIDRLTKKISKLVAEQVECQQGIMATKCEYTALGKSCDFPGTMSPDTHGPGKWYCRFHYQQLHGGLSEEEAASGVRERLASGTPPDGREQALQAKMAERRTEQDPMMIIADKLAAGHGNREDKAEFLGLFRAKLKGLVAGQKARAA